MAKTYTTVVGALLFIVGVLGFIPGLSTDNDHGSLLLGFIQINPAQSVIHVVTGLVALGALASAREYYLRSYVRVFGVVYALVALWGLPAFTGTYDGVLFGLIHVNIWTELVHVLIGAWGLYVGFAAGNNAPAKVSAQ